MTKSLHPLIIFFWGHILFVRVQCRGTLGILNESKLSERKELCFRRCDIGFQADDKETSSKEMFGRRSCYEKCLREDGEMKSVKTKRRAFPDEQRTSLFKRVRRDSSSNVGIKHNHSNCFPGNADSNATAMVPDRQIIEFREFKATGRYQGTITWEPLRNESVHFTGYKILIIYQWAKSSESIECVEVTKNVTQYTITNSSSGMTKNSRFDFVVVSVPHSETLDKTFYKNQPMCVLPPKGPSVCPDKPGTTSATEISNTPSSLPTSEINNTASSPLTSEMNKASRSPQTSGDTNETIPYVLGAVSISVFVIIVTALIVLLRCRRQKPPNPFPLTDMQFEYDAFVIYSSEDSDWVVRTLIPTLEEKHGLKCCVHYRDFLLGVPFRQNMADSVYKSRKTIAVVSTHFFNSNYCGTELDYALYRLMEKKDDSLIVIKLDDVDSRKLPRELQKRSYIDYLKSTYKETWEKKLVKCLTSTRSLPE